MNTPNEKNGHSKMETWVAGASVKLPLFCSKGSGTESLMSSAVIESSFKRIYNKNKEVKDQYVNFL